MIKTIFYVAIGGAAGSVLRFLITVFINKFWQNNFPIATFLINCLGCFLIGFLMAYFSNESTHSNLKWLLITGFCGGFTTFSAFGFENFNLIQNQNSFLAILYIGLSIFGGILSVWLGIMIGK